MSLIPDRGIPITLALMRKDGTIKRVRLGVALSGDDGLTLQVAEAGLERLREVLLGRPVLEAAAPAVAPAGGPASIQELEVYEVGSGSGARASWRSRVARASKAVPRTSQNWAST